MARTRFIRTPSLRYKALAAASMAVLAAAMLGATASAGPKQAGGLSAKVVVDWNANAIDAVLKAKTTNGVPSTPPGGRSITNAEGFVYLGYAQAAVYDAVTKIAGRYVPYHQFAADAAGASVHEAVIAAEYWTLFRLFSGPTFKNSGDAVVDAANKAVSDLLTSQFAAAIPVSPSASQAAGLAVGKAAADDILAFRAGDGRNAPTAAYGQGPLAPGLWIFAAPPSAQFAATPWLGFMRPFMLNSASQFHPGPPPALTSEAYEEQFNEVKAYGAKNSTVRSPEQTAIAYFWIANAFAQYNKAFRDLVAAHNMDLVDAARALAMADLVASDSVIGCWESKYTYQFWRPTTAIQHADIDGNPDTVADPTWLPLLTTPNHPDYLSGHGCLTGAMADVFAALLGTKRINVDIPGSENGANTLTTSRHFATVKDLLRQIVDARVWNGYHFRGSVEAGVVLGQRVANWTLKRYFLPVDDDNGDGGDHGGND
jgi:PAP2 superfamily